ncbi:hypothetical protein ACFE04_014846 [Oxalis oulophora]
MPFKSILGEVRDSIGSLSRRSLSSQSNSKPTTTSRTSRRARSHIAPEGESSSSSFSLLPFQESQWANLPPELLHDIIQRLEATETSWPARRNVVSCALVCKTWREVTKQIVKTPELCGLLTFPVSLKQPGPRDGLIQCFIRRERATATYRLYLGLSPALTGENSKLLLAARKIKRATYTYFIISLVEDDFSKSSNACVGKLRSNFLGTKFTIYDTKPPQNLGMQSNPKLNRKYCLTQVSSRPAVTSCNIASIYYELNVLRTRGPRRMQCTMQTIPFDAIQEGGSAPTLDQLESGDCVKSSLVLNNKAPRWHEQLQCWCLNFKGRVTVASVKNFQLVAAVEPNPNNIPLPEQEKVILQFGKIGKDIFTMDYRYPLSAFQAFAICLSGFDTKPACE